MSKGNFHAAQSTSSETVRSRGDGYEDDEIRALLKLSARSDSPCSDVKVPGERHLRAVRRKLDKFGRLEHALAALVRRCDPGRTDCPVLEALLADFGAQGSRPA